MSSPNPYTGSLLHYVKLRGHKHEERMHPFHQWVKSRRQENVWPYARVTTGLSSSTVTIGDEFNQNPRTCLNFGSQDYLGLASHPEVIAAAQDAIQQHGIHSAGSPVLTGRTNILLELENNLAQTLNKESAIIYPTGWAAGFGILAGLIRPSDHVLIDELSHNCLQEGARHNTSNVTKFSHNNLEDLRQKLIALRAQDAKLPLFVVTESLFSMDSDSPDLPAFIQLCREFQATSILDIAHDFGSMGTQGLGLLESTTPENYPDLIMGSFSKTFACNGGFVACSADATQYLRYFSPTHIFSNAQSPVQTAIANKCHEIAFSNPGLILRQKLLKNINSLRAHLSQQGFQLGGLPSPIVPTYVGNETLARKTSRNAEANNLIANLVEFPAVPRGKARFRFQVMATHTEQEIQQAAHALSQALKNATNSEPSRANQQSLTT